MITQSFYKQYINYMYDFFPLSTLSMNFQRALECGVAFERSSIFLLDKEAS